MCAARTSILKGSRQKSSIFRFYQFFNIKAIACLFFSCTCMFCMNSSIVMMMSIVNDLVDTVYYLLLYYDAVMDSIVAHTQSLSLVCMCISFFFV